MDEQFKAYSRAIDSKIDEQSRAIARRLEENDKKFEEMMRLMRELSANRSNEGPESARPDSSRGTFAPRPLGFVPKVEFPKFDGTGARNWVKNVSNILHCVKFLKIKRLI